MKLFTVLSACLALGSTVTTAAAAAAAKPNSKVTSTSYSYLLRSHVINGGRKDFEGLYLQGYHTGAGLNDVVLVKQSQSIGSVARGELVNGSQFFDFGDYPATLTMAGGFSYDAWYPLSIPIGVYTTDLFLNATGLQSDYYSFGGWLACPWAHGVPQLFYRDIFYNQFKYPTPGCADVQLYPAEKGKFFEIKGLSRPRSEGEGEGAADLIA